MIGSASGFHPRAGCLGRTGVLAVVLISVREGCSPGAGTVTCRHCCAPGLGFGAALGLALAAHTASIAVMEVVDNVAMLAIPGAMEAGLADPLFWCSLALSLVVAATAIFPVNRWLIARGRGHAVLHAHHCHRH